MAAGPGVGGHAGRLPRLPAAAGRGSGLTAPGLAAPGLTAPGLTAPGLTTPGLTTSGRPGPPGYAGGPRPARTGCPMA
ncbi:hypothetical protein BM536_024310 [Streptomyces phaeoluteigriseus]|uniref:Uncharacterized protein n=1 Tax=Streptomyces phaeoluteigriseus TaxID=114686 RepID=A0A1V6MRN6_9ACTN|nr:hypothetical protein BM536_024310 [Streptomyces phaeoluteigriseus]